MKYYVSIALVLFLGLSVFAQDIAMHTPKVLNAAGMLWEQDIIDLGEVEKGSLTDTRFTFTNNGTQPLVIERVKTSCGCTASDYPKEPIQPGQTASIEVSYSAKTIGSFHKSITVYSNAVEPVTTLRIKGSVK